MASGYMIVELYCLETNTVIASVNVPDGSPACLTGAVDLAEGDWTLCIRMYSSSWEGWGSYTGAGMQVIVAQTVDEIGCVGVGGGSCS